MTEIHNDVLDTLQYQYCRTCATLTAPAISIFLDDCCDLHDIIKKYLPISVSDGDGLPGYLCQKCADTLKSWDSFVTGVLNAEKRLTEIFADGFGDQSKLENFGVGSDSEDEPLIKILNITKKKKGRRKKGGAVSASESSGSTKHVNGTKSETMCLVCMKRTSDLTLHYSKSSGCHRLAVRHCNVCGKEVSDLTGHGLHLYSHLDINPENSDLSCCRLCGTMFPETLPLIGHLITHLEDRNTVHCVTCGRGVLKATLKRHVVTHSGEKRFTCHHCGKVYSQVCGLLRHVRVTHEGKRRYKCPICSAIFQSNNELRAHQLDHEDPCPFQCEACGRTFPSQKHLYHHCKYHHTENGLRVSCPSCNRVFSSASVLRRHQKVVHLRLKEFQCEVCSAQLSTKQYLQEHLRIHTTERPEVCPVCGKTFQMSSNLRQHMKTHLERRQVCEVCEKRFARRCQLLIHMGSHKGVPPSQCAHCGQLFVLKVDLKKHLSAMHSLTANKPICIIASVTSDI